MRQIFRTGHFQALLPLFALAAACSASNFKGATPQKDPKQDANSKNNGALKNSAGKEKLQRADDGSENMTAEGSKNGPGSENVNGGLSQGKIPGSEGLPTSPQVCSEEYRALRIAIVVDNTLSNNCTPGVVQTGEGGWCGTDPIKPNSPRGDADGFTERQNAIFRTILKVTNLDKQVSSKDPAFRGSEVGIVSFPRSGEEYDKYKLHSGAGTIFPEKMTSSLSLVPDDTFQNNLWNMLKFTHKPAGATPYEVAFKGAHDLLKAGRNPQDPRPDVVLFITDGLPTDQRPSLVRAARAMLGTTPVILFSLYEPGKNSETQNAPAKSTLSDGWNSPTLQWGHRPNENDGYPNFESYWKELLKLPSEISNSVIEVEGSQKLNAELDRILGVLQSCK